MVKLAGAKPVILETSEASGFKVTAEQLREAITPNTRLLILNSPCNPTGAVYTPEILSDEIYEKLVYDGAEHASVASFSPDHCAHTIVVNGFSKAFAMTGWRLGYLAAPEPIAKAVNAIQSHSTSNPTSFAQKGAVAALVGPQDHLSAWLAEYDKRRTFALNRLKAMPGVECIPAKGAFYLFPNISSFGLSSIDFCAKLLEEQEVAAVPGAAFGADYGIRISYATSMSNLERGLDRIEKFVRDLAG